MQQLPEDLGRLAHAMLESMGAGLIDDVNDRVQLGVKRFAQALTRVKPEIRHSDAIEVISAALGFKGWQDLNASLSRLDDNTAGLIKRLSLVVNVPVAPYDRPCAHEVKDLKTVAARIGEMLGVDEASVLDKVVAFLHEARSFDDLLARDPCIAGPAYEVVYDDPESEGAYVRITPMGIAALRALDHELPTFVGDEALREEDFGEPDRQRLIDRTEAIVTASPLCFPAWAYLLATLGMEDPGRTLQVADKCFGILMEFLGTVDELDCDDAHLAPLFVTTRYMMERLIECDEALAAYEAGRAVLSLLDGEDPYNLRFLLAAALCSEDLDTELYDEVDFEGLLEDFTDGVTAGDVDSLLCVGMLMLRHEDFDPAEAFSYLARASLCTHGALRHALDGDPAELLDIEPGLADATKFTALLVWSFRAADTQLCDDVARVLNTAAMRTAERQVIELYDSIDDDDDDSLYSANLRLCWTSEIVSRSRTMSQKLAQSWGRLTSQKMS